MLKVLIVDDEYYFRQYLKTCIPWEEKGYSVIGEAEDGEEALSMMEKERPDIVILDVNMPIIDGIQLCKAISERKLPVKIIILSGHNEFQYAQKAMKYGVKSYLLKPLDENELYQALEEMKKEIDEHKDYQGKLSTLQKQMKKNVPLLEEKILHDLICKMPAAGWSGDYKHREWVEEHLKGSSFLVFVTEIGGEEKSQWTADDWELWRYAVKNIVQESLPSEMNSYFSRDVNDTVICLVSGEGNPEDMARRICRCAANVERYIAHKLPFSVTIGIGRCMESIVSIPNSYQQAVFTLKNKYNQPKSKILEYEKTKSSLSQATFFDSDLRKSILVSLRQKDAVSIEKILGEVFDKAQKKHISYDMLQCHCTEFIFICLEYLGEIAVPFEDIFGQGVSPMDMLKEISTVREARQEILKLYRRVADYMGKERPTRALRQIEEIKEYILAHLCQAEFKISDISEAFYVNYHHLCHSFKKQTGLTLNQYITEQRIEKAKSLIDSGCRNITLLAEQVGYKELGYFSKCFKRQTGVTPSKYMEEKKETPQNYQ